MGLVRYVHRSELDGSSAGEWLLPGQGLLLSRVGGHWRVLPSLWVDTHNLCEQDAPSWLERRWKWLIRHGLHLAEFARRRDAQAAALYALEHDPLPPDRKRSEAPCA